MLERTENS